MDMAKRREAHWRSSVEKACEDLLYVMDPEQSMQPTYSRMLSATIDVIMAEFDRVRSDASDEAET